MRKPVFFLIMFTVLLAFFIRAGLSFSATDYRSSEKSVEIVLWDSFEPEEIDLIVSRNTVTHLQITIPNKSGVQ